MEHIVVPGTSHVFSQLNFATVNYGGFYFPDDATKALKG